MKTFQGAVNIVNRLNSHPLRRQSRNAVTGKETMEGWLEILGIDNKRFTKIRVIHVAGTKGKGTICLYSANIISQYQKLRRVLEKIGCLTSPHVTDIRERIQINSRWISHELFSRNVYYLWGQIASYCSQKGYTANPKPALSRSPGFLALLVLYTFIQEEVNIAVVETGVGGEMDSINVIPNPCATRITTLGIDHANVLGNSIESIAWHKSGIFKSGSPAFTVEQDHSAMNILYQRSIEKKITGHLVVVPKALVKRYGISVKPDMPFQRRNTALAIALSETYLKEIEPSFVMTPELARTIERTKLPGRCEIISRRNTWLLSLAHNEISVQAIIEWLERDMTMPQYANATKILLFCSSQERDSKVILEIINRSTCGFDRVIFCSANSGIDNGK